MCKADRGAMKQKWPDEVMELRRQERLDRLNFFMRDKRIPEGLRSAAGKGCTLNLLTGWFQNSKWRTALYVTKEAASESWERFKVSAELFWHYRVMRRSREETGRRVFGAEEAGEAEPEEEWPEEVSL